MNATSLPDAAAESSVDFCSAIVPPSPSKSIPTAVKSSHNGKPMESCQPSPSTTMFEPSMERHGEENAKSWPVDFRAKTYLRVGLVPELMASEADSGEKWRESSVKYDPASHSLKTRQTLLFGDSTESCVTLPEWGMMRGGVCSPLAPLVLHTHESECFFWPTPRAGRPGSRPNGKGGKILQEEVQIAAGIRKRGQKLDGIKLSPLNPAWADWLMGWPVDWTDSKPLATDKFRQWCNSHGIPCGVAEDENDKVSHSTPPQ